MSISSSDDFLVLFSTLVLKYLCFVHLTMEKTQVAFVYKELKDTNYFKSDQFITIVVA